MGLIVQETIGIRIAILICGFWMRITIQTDVFFLQSINFYREFFYINNQDEDSHCERFLTLSGSSFDCKQTNKLK